MRNTRKIIAAFFSTTFISLRQEKKVVIAVTAAFCLLFIFLTGIITRYEFIPDWISTIPTLFTPAHPLYDTFAITFRLSEHWLFNLDLQMAIGFLIFSALVAANTAVFFRLLRQRTVRAGGLALGVGGGIASFLAFFGCCISPLTIAIFGSGIVFALSPYSVFIQGLAAVLLASNLIYLARKVLSMPVA